MKAADKPLGRSSAGGSKPRELKQERAVRTREQVLSAAATAFAKRGFPAVTILDVAELTGMTKGAVYFHYANKEALAIAVAEEFYQRLPLIFEDVRKAGLPPVKAVAELLHRTAVAFRDDTIIQAGARLQIESSLIDATLPRPFDGYTDSITELLHEAKEAGELPASCKPEVLGRVLGAAFFGVQHISWRLNNRADLAERVEEIIEAVLPQTTQGPARKAS
ncbi:ScbR family autoregulator-binding transcription factor [Streptomyces sioyaensis]|uniref:ScbR family autoregulator-binding transcription factor n=1 Tax=Streptomyces sioyaensis TaxID=67364 RepID=UPI001FD564AA|nr:ScbR family autoregulator-binding transcription factor [Streptomyces sioyaensis]